MTEQHRMHVQLHDFVNTKNINNPVHASYKKYTIWICHTYSETVSCYQENTLMKSLTESRL